MTFIRHAFILSGVLAAQAICSGFVIAAERPAATANAAVVYWQAFALVPEPFAEPEKAKYEAAVANPAAPVADDLAPLIAKFGNSLGELHRATKIAACDWNLDYEAGAGCLLPHLEKARALSKAALLRARLGFAAGKTNKAVADVMAVLKLARDCGSNPMIISLLVGAAIEKSATDVLAAHLGGLSPAQLDRLAAAIAALPAAPSVADGIRLDGQVSCDWLTRILEAEVANGADPKAGGRFLAGLTAGVTSGYPTRPRDAADAARRKRLEAFSGADVRESLRLLRADYDKAVAIAELPATERREKFPAFEARITETLAVETREADLRELSRLFLPAIQAFPERIDEADVRRQLLVLAIKVQRQGAEAIRGSTIPGHGPVEYRATDTGFELRCQPGSTDKPVVLQVGHALPSCASTASRLPVPESSAVGRVVVTLPGAGSQDRERVIEDRKAVERFVAFLRAHNDGWRKPWGTFPTSQYTVSLKRGEELLLVVWVGTNWIGGREGGGGASDNRLRSLSDRERAEVLEILGIPKE